MNNTEMAHLVQLAMNSYTNILDKISDPRTSEWPLIYSPIPTGVMVVMYLYTVVILGPRLMRDRKPFKLRQMMIAYNGFQVAYSVYMMFEHLMSGWFLDYSYVCEPVDYSTNKTAMRMANLCWWYYISKITEFCDTLFFILRKKDSQVTLLHLYHHSLTPMEAWFLVKFLPGGHGTFGNLINNFVHIVMYTYYMISAMGPEYHKYLWWKKYLTSIQLLQFTIVFIHSAQLLWIDCGYPRLMAPLLILHSSIFFVLFANFYYQEYARSQKKSLKSQ